MIIYKMDILKVLKENGYNTNRIRKEKIFGEKTIQNIRENKQITLKTIDTICNILQCKICDIIEYVPDDNRKNKE